MVMSGCTNGLSLLDDDTQVLLCLFNRVEPPEIGVLVQLGQEDKFCQPVKEIIRDMSVP